MHKPNTPHQAPGFSVAPHQACPHPDTATCACPSVDPYECVGLRYETDEGLDPCDCSCHDFCAWCGCEPHDECGCECHDGAPAPVLPPCRHCGAPTPRPDACERCYRALALLELRVDELLAAHDDRPAAELAAALTGLGLAASEILGRVAVVTNAGVLALWTALSWCPWTNALTVEWTGPGVEGVQRRRRHVLVALLAELVFAASLQAAEVEP